MSRVEVVSVPPTRLCFAWPMPSGVPSTFETVNVVPSTTDAMTPGTPASAAASAAARLAYCTSVVEPLSRKVGFGDVDVEVTRAE